MRFGYRAARLFTGDLLLAPGTVVLRDRVIDWVGRDAPPDVPVEDLGDATLLPGMIDAHSHVSIDPSLGDQIGQLRRPAAPQVLSARHHVPIDLRSGVTTMRVMGEEWGVDFHIHREIEAGRVKGPDLICSGVQIARCGHHGHALTCVQNGDEIARLARLNVSRGARALKIFATGGVSSSHTSDEPPFTADEIGRAATVAHDAGLRLAAHAHGGAGALRAIEGGVDTIEHGASLDETCLNEILKRNLVIVGTFSILYHPAGIERGDAGNPAVVEKLLRARESAERSWRAILASGARIALGTDSMHGQLAYDASRLVQFGATPARAIHAATVGGAQACGLTDRGRLAAGLRADVLAVKGDPFADIGALAAPILVVANGQQVALTR